MNNGAVLFVAFIIALALQTAWSLRKWSKQNKSATANHICEGCGQKLSKNENFCSKCGQSVAEEKTKQVETKAIAKEASTQPAPKKSYKGLFIILGIIGVYSAITLIGVALTPDTPLVWQKYSSTDGKYSLEFPCSPSSKDTPITSNGATFSQNLVQCTIDGDKEFNMGTITYPSDLEITDQRTLLKNGLNGMTSSGKRTIETSSETTFQNYPATNYVLKDTDNYVYKGKMILVGNKLYQITTVNKDSENENSDRFIASLVIN